MLHSDLEEVLLAHINYCKCIIHTYIHISIQQCGAFGNVREVYFYPTRIAASVVFAGADPRASGHVMNDLQDMRIIVETNHQVRSSLFIMVVLVSM